MDHDAQRLRVPDLSRARSLGLLLSPYAGLFGFLLVPAFFGLGLLLIPVGIWVESRRRRRACPRGGGRRSTSPAAAPGRLSRPSLGSPWSTSRLSRWPASAPSSYSESNRFCGQLCHVPMTAGVHRARAGRRTRESTASTATSPPRPPGLSRQDERHAAAVQLVTNSYNRPIRSPATGSPCPRRPASAATRRWRPNARSSACSASTRTTKAARSWPPR